MFRVTLVEGEDELAEFTFDQEVVTIGRDRHCDIIVANARASRYHATIERTHRGYVLADLSSHNGTFVHGKRVRHHRLDDEDAFSIARQTFRFLQTESTDELDELEEELSFSSSQSQPVVIEPGLETEPDLDVVLQEIKASPPARLVQLAPTRRVFDIDGERVVIGRNAASEIRLHGLLVPHQAAVLVREDDAYRVLGVSRRFRLNGRRAEGVALKDGDLLTIGRHRFRYVIDQRD